MNTGTEWEIRVREFCSAFPEAREKPSHGQPTWFAGKGRVFAVFTHDHHGDGRTALWLPAPPGIQEALVAADPAAFFRPPYVGPSGWIGVVLTVADYEDAKGMIEQSYRLVAHPRLVALLDA